MRSLRPVEVVRGLGGDLAARGRKPGEFQPDLIRRNDVFQEFGSIPVANEMGEWVRGVVFADRHRAYARKVEVRQSGFLGPGIECRLDLRKVPLRFDLRGNVEASVAQAGHNIF